MAVNNLQFLMAIAALLLMLALSACIPAEIREGETLYLRHCSACHGTGVWGTKRAPPLHPETRQEIIQQVRNPKGEMPPVDRQR